jgi:ABC-type glycerol-3-phosphate transport system permease component
MVAVTKKSPIKKKNKFVSFIKKYWGQIFIVIALLILAILVLYPLFIMVMRSFKISADDYADPYSLPKKVTFENYKAIWAYIKDSYLNSFLTTMGVTIGTVICASFLAYAFTKFNFPGKKIIFYLIISLMMIPGILTLIARYQEVISLNLLNSLWGVILPGVAGYIPMAFMLLFTFFNGIPRDLFEAADIDGANDFKVYLRIVLPLSQPILYTIAIQTFVGEWNDYLWARLVLIDENVQTLPINLYALTSYLGEGYGMYPVVFAGFVLSALPLVIIFILASKQFIEGMTSGAFKM